MSVTEMKRRDFLSGFIGATLMMGMSRTAVAQFDGAIAVNELMAPQSLPDLPIGDNNAPITMIEYASLTCSHCADFAVNTFPTLKKDYIDTGKVLYILREFPLDPLATAAFMLARFAGPQKRNIVVELLFQKQEQWANTKTPVDALQNIVQQMGISKEDFEKCLRDEPLNKMVEQERDEAENKFAVSATPCFFINGNRYSGTFSAKDIPNILTAAGGTVK